MGRRLQGIPFHPSAAEYYQDDESTGWQYEALSGNINLGADCNVAHVQPNGLYHYHGLPAPLVGGAEYSMTQVGWGSDGYPNYALWGHSVADDPASPIQVLRSSYVLKSGQRPSSATDPGGAYDGTFIQDYEYDANAGDLDVCNGRYGYTPEYGLTCYYVATAEWPLLPRCVVAEQRMSFLGAGGGGGPPGGG